MDYLKFDNDKLYEKIQHNEKVDYVLLNGWVRTNRDNGSIGFIEFNDGTYFNNIQLVYTLENVKENYSKIKAIKTGEAISCKGRVILTPNNRQPFEIQVDDIDVLGTVSDDYPLQKKRHSFEFLREIAHIRPRANTFYALYKVRSVLAMAIHEFFQTNNFVYIHTPIITSNDCEGAGQVFDVTTKGKDPFSFFKQHVNLTVSGQLHVEPFA